MTPTDSQRVPDVLAMARSMIEAHATTDLVRARACGVAHRTYTVMEPPPPRSSDRERAREHAPQVDRSRW